MMEHRFEFYVRGITHGQCIMLFNVAVDHIDTCGGCIREFHLWTPNEDNYGEGHLAFCVGGLESNGHIGMFNTLTAAVEGYGGRVVFWTVSGSEETEDD